MRLTHLKVQGFRCFLAEQHIDFPPSGIVPIVGRTLDGGSSGAGKTSVLQAIAYALKFSSFSAGAQQSWVDDAPKLQVELGLETEDRQERLVIRRGKKTEVLLNDEQVAKGSTEVDQYLTRYFGLEPDLLQVLTFRPQRKAGLFLGLTPAKKRIFLATVLGLRRFEELADALTKEVTAGQRQLDIDENTLKMLSYPDEPPALITGVQHKDDFFDGELSLDQPDLSAYDQWEKSGSELGEAVVKDLNRERVALQALQAEERQALQVIAADKGAELAALPMPEVVNLYADEQRLIDERLLKLANKHSELQEKRKELEAARRGQQGRVDSFRPAAARDGQNLATCMELIAHLRENRCMTCGQHWNDINKLAEAEAAAAQLRTQIETSSRIAETAAKSIPVFEDELVKNQEALAHIQAGCEQLKSRASQIQRRLAEDVGEARLLHQKERQRIEEIYVNLADGCRARFRDLLLEANKRCSDFEARLAQYRNGVQSCRSARAAVQAKLNQARTQNGLIETMRRARRAAFELQSNLQSKVWAGKLSVAERQDLQVATRAFLGAISNEVLAEISAEANAMMASLPNVKGVGIRFTTESLTDSGNLKQEIRTVFTVGGIDDVEPEAQLSGGQLTSVELAVDRAVSKVLRRRQGGQRLPSWLALDEAFDGHDVLTKEACLDFLRSETGDSQVLVIDHASEFREAFDHVITVTQTDAGGKIDIS